MLGEAYVCVLLLATSTACAKSLYINIYERERTICIHVSFTYAMINGDAKTVRIYRVLLLS